jgi:hypothetical protein
MQSLRYGMAELILAEKNNWLKICQQVDEGVVQLFYNQTGSLILRML